MLYDISCMWNLKKHNKLVSITKKRLTDTENKLAGTSGERRDKVWQSGRYKLLCVK